MHLRLACRMNVKNETALILRAHAERAVSANALGKNLLQPIYSDDIMILTFKKGHGFDQIRSRSCPFLVLRLFNTCKLIARC